MSSLEHGYEKRIRSFYDRSNEKDIVSKYLKEIVGRKEFSSAIDIGAGEGVLTKCFDGQTKNLTILETNEVFFLKLREEFPFAHVLQQSIEDFEFREPVDFILMSQVLYYIPPDRWAHLVQKLSQNKTDPGQLVLIQNVDRGDWWSIVGRYLEKSPALLPFRYGSWDQFKAQTLQKLNPNFETIPYVYQVFFESEEDLVRYAWQVMLGAQHEDESLYRDLQTYIHENFQEQISRGVMDWPAEIIVL